VFLSAGSAFGQINVIDEDFNDVAVSYTPSTADFSDGSGDFFGRVDSDGISITSSYVVNGADDGYFAAMDFDGAGSEQTLTWSGLDVTGNTGVTFSIKLAEDDDGSDQDWDTGSVLALEVSYDGGSSWTPFFAVESASGTNSEPRVDTNLDGTGDGTEITDTFATFSGSVPGAMGETTMSIRIRIDDLDAGDEDIAIEDVVVTALGLSPPIECYTNLFQGIQLPVGAGEVVSHSKVGSEYYLAVTDNPNGGVSIYEWADTTQKYVFARSIDIASEVTDFDSVSSVTLDPRGTGLGAAVAQTVDPLADADFSTPELGRIVFFDVTDGSIEGQSGTGFHPDMVNIGESGYVAVANEGEYAWDTDAESGLPAEDEPGSVSLYDLSAVTVGNFGAATSATEVRIDFSSADLTGIRYGTASEMEPEYIDFADSGNAILVGCQENNAIAALNDLSGIFAAPASASWEVYSLGSVTYISDASDKDGIDISDQITGLHMPDAIAVYEVGGKTYVVTADEGDARPDDSDIERAGDFADTADIVAIPAYDDGDGPVTQAEFAALLDDNDELGRIDILLDQSLVGGQINDIIGLGSRGVSVWEYSDTSLSLTRLSHLPLEGFLAAEDPARHNSNDGGDPGEFDKRSDNKGPEPEAVDVIEIDGKIVAMVGNERQNGIVMVDITDPATPQAVTYLNNRDNGLISPETAKAVPASESPTGSELVIFGYEGDDGIAGGIGIYNFEEADDFKLTVLHNNDGESDLFEYQGSPNHGGIARFKTAMDEHFEFYSNLGHGVVEVFAGDSFLAGPEFSASLESGLPGARTFYDALALSLIGYDAFAIGNHELDFGPDVLAEFIGDAQTFNPSLYLSANLDFANEVDMLAQVNAGNVAKSALLDVATESGVKKVGVIGATTANLPFISSPRDTIISAVAGAVNGEVASLLGQGADAIVLVSHLQGLDEDEDLVPSLAAGIDVIVAGGGDELLVDQTADSPRDLYGAGAPASVIDTAVFGGDSTENGYPVISTGTDLGGNNIPIVTTGGSYGYLGRLTLCFDGVGGVTVEETSNPSLIVDASFDATNGYVLDQDVLDEIAPVETFVDGLASNIIGETIATLPQSSNLIRSDERAVGNLVADAYLAKAQAEAANFGADVPQVALVNGGGIRAPIPAGDISELTTFNVSPFGNFVAIVEDITTADLLLLLENAYSRTVDNDAGSGVDPQRQGGGTGRFAQVAGMSVVYDISKTPLALDSGTETITTQGQRVVFAELSDGTDLIVDGEPVAGITVDITLPFFNANGGDQYFRYAPGLSFYTSQNYPVIPLIGITDQQALEDYIVSLDTLDPEPELDLDPRYDAVKDNRIVTISDVDSDGIQDPVEDELGTYAGTSDGMVADFNTADQLALIAAKVTEGENNVTSDPGAFGLFTEDSIVDLAMNGVIGAVTNPGPSGTADLEIGIYSTTDLTLPFPAGWTFETTETVVVDAPAGKAFYRLNADQP